MAASATYLRVSSSFVRSVLTTHQRPVFTAPRKVGGDI